MSDWMKALHVSRDRRCCALYCITPPYLLRAIAERGTPAQRAQAERSLQVTANLQAHRWAIARGQAEPAVPQVREKQRRVHDAGQGSSLPGRLVRSEGEPATGDPAVDEAYDGAGATYDLFWEVYERNSLDDQGLLLVSTVHYRRGFDNAFWDGEQMVYGDGDEDLPPRQRLFNRFTVSVDIIGHELAHAVTQFTANLTYADQSGALNESLSDVFGALVKQRQLGQTAEEADWLIGAGLFTQNVNGDALRSMRAPGTAFDDPILGRDPQPAHMRDFVLTRDDNGGVHINSGIPNHAFFRTAVEIGGFAWEKAGLIWYQALRDKLGTESNFQDAARLTFETAGELFGSGSSEQQAVRDGWSAVGVTLDGPVGRPPIPRPDDGGSRVEVEFMHIHFERSGGFAGISLTVEVESSDLPEEEARALVEQIQAANFFALPPVIKPSRHGADRFQYRLTVTSGGQEHTVEVSEGEMPESLRPLVEHLTRLARGSAGET